ncbi:MAG: hypothetical protein EA409_13175 [Saprospirales bacterium]|jgi:predicted  nucleic acid-binding Zn-ribbon protein|nr:MAG: hypothetical protein EA409_13175 [Saprospirales bacterium]
MATKKEVSIADKLKSLYQLQLVDSEIDKIHVLKGELPAEVSDLEDEVAGLETRINKIKDAISEIEQQVSRHQGNIADSNALIERYLEQLKQVKNNREFDALNKEIEYQKLEIQLSEKKIREATGQIEIKQASLDTAEEKRDKRLNNLEVKQKELKEIIKKTEKEETQLLKESEKARKQIDERLMRAYDKIRKSYRNGLAVVTIKRDACGGCYNLVPPQLQIEVGLAKKIIVCENCGRILVDEDLLQTEE